MNRASIAYSDRAFYSGAAITHNCTGTHSPPEVDHMCIDLSAPVAVEDTPAIVTWL
jgi:hypothetical protein